MLSHIFSDNVRGLLEVIDRQVYPRLVAYLGVGKLVRSDLTLCTWNIYDYHSLSNRGVDLNIRTIRWVPRDSKATQAEACSKPVTTSASFYTYMLTAFIVPALKTEYWNVGEILMIENGCRHRGRKPLSFLTGLECRAAVYRCWCRWSDLEVGNRGRSVGR